MTTSSIATTPRPAIDVEAPVDTRTATFALG